MVLFLLTSCVDDGKDGSGGEDGTDGINGTEGTKGTKGEKGTKGTKGADGADGARGIPGPNGPPGRGGFPGDPGPTGLTGADGAIGATGLTGPTGARGATGADGAEGLAGADGVSMTNATVISDIYFNLDNEQCEANAIENITNIPINVNYVSVPIGDEVLSVSGMAEAVMTKIKIQAIGDVFFHISFPVPVEQDDYYVRVKIADDIAIVTPTESQKRCSHFEIDVYDLSISNTSSPHEAFIEPIISNHFERISTGEMQRRNTTTIKLNIHIHPEVMLVFTFTREYLFTDTISHFNEAGGDHDFTGFSAPYEPFENENLDTVMETVDDFVDLLKIEEGLRTP